MFGAENRSPNFDDFAILAYVREGPCIKGRGGGVRVEKNFFSDFDSKFSVLSPTFYRISKFGPVDPKFADLSGWVGPPRGSFLDIWRNSMTKQSKNVPKCTLMSFK